MATRASLMDFQTPRIVSEDADERSGRFTIEPLDRGFGYTFGNSLRRVLLSSLEGAAVTSVKIEGVAHEFTTLQGVREDVTDILLNLKNLVCVLHGESPEIEVHLAKRGAGKVTAADIAPARPGSLNPTSLNTVKSAASAATHRAFSALLIAIVPFDTSTCVAPSDLHRSRKSSTIRSSANRSNSVPPK